MCYIEHIHLINKSPSGLTSRQIGKLVKLSSRSFLHHFRNDPGIRREKHGGVYVYFSANPEIYDQQMKNHINDIATVQKIIDADAVVILTAVIRCHQISFEQIMTLPQIKDRGFSSAVVNEFLDRHDLLKKRQLQSSKTTQETCG